MAAHAPSREKSVAHSGLMRDKRRMLSNGTSVIRRWITVLFTFAAWLLLSNHCALGVVASPASMESETGGCPMHSAPVKKKEAAKPPCCKEVRAILAKCVTANPGVVRAIARCDYAPDISPKPTRNVVEIAEIDTGPPGCFSFAESVLQESMLVHAPPLS